MSEVPNGTAAKQPTPGAGLVGAACAAAQPVVPVPVPSNNSSAMQFFAQDPNDDRDAVSTIPCIQMYVVHLACL
jgi:hypothetical protein